MTLQFDGTDVVWEEEEGKLVLTAAIDPKEMIPAVLAGCWSQHVELCELGNDTIAQLLFFGQLQLFLRPLLELLVGHFLTNLPSGLSKVEIESSLRQWSKEARSGFLTGLKQDLPIKKELTAQHVLCALSVCVIRQSGRFAGNAKTSKKAVDILKDEVLESLDRVLDNWEWESMEYYAESHKEGA